jgi:uncharacterized protein
MKVTVVWARASLQDLVEVELPEGAMVGQAVDRSGLLVHYGLDGATLGLAVYGRRASWDTPLAEGDRIELTRPLEIDPKAARIARARMSAQGRSQARIGPEPRNAGDGPVGPLPKALRRVTQRRPK